MMEEEELPEGMYMRAGNEPPVHEESDESSSSTSSSSSDESSEGDESMEEGEDRSRKRNEEYNGEEPEAKRHRAELPADPREWTGLEWESVQEEVIHLAKRRNRVEGIVQIVDKKARGCRMVSNKVVRKGQMDQFKADI
jgi:hypothetical protein